MTVFVLRPGRIALALGVGAVVGAGIVTAAILLPVVLDPRPVADNLGTAAAMAPLFFIAALIVWVLGLAVIGGPVWAMLHGRGRRRPADALMLGLTATFLVAFLLNHLLMSGTTGFSADGRVLIENGFRTPYGWFMLLKDCVLLSLLGGLVAMVIWRIAYRTER